MTDTSSIVINAHFEVKKTLIFSQATIYGVNHSYAELEFFIATHKHLHIVLSATPPQNDNCFSGAINVILLHGLKAHVTSEIMFSMKSCDREKKNCKCLLFFSFYLT